jgi:hypothetical protein
VETNAVLKRAAPPIDAVIVERGEKLGEQAVMGPM